MTDGYKIKRVLVWQGGVEKQIYPATWNPGANTLAYWKLDGNLNDSSGNGYTLTNAGNASFITDNSIGRTVLSCSGVKGGNSYVYTTGLPSSTTNQITINVWCKGLTGFENARGLFDTRVVNSDGNNDGIRWETYNNALHFYIGENVKDHNTAVSVSITSGELTSWGLWTVTYNKSNRAYSIYYNGVLKTSGTSSYNPSSLWLSNFTLGIGYATVSNIFNRSYYGYIGAVDIEDNIQSQQDITNYYNQTKGNYGL